MKEEEVIDGIETTCEVPSPDDYSVAGHLAAAISRRYELELKTHWVLFCPELDVDEERLRPAYAVVPRDWFPQAEFTLAQAPPLVIDVASKAEARHVFDRRVPALLSIGCKDVWVCDIASGLLRAFNVDGSAWSGPLKDSIRLPPFEDTEVGLRS
ncbi:MAG: hypothetical protein AB8I08_39940 [Sandaracinaceae bacterium]